MGMLTNPSKSHLIISGDEHYPEKQSRFERIHRKSGFAISDTLGTA